MIKNLTISKFITVFLLSIFVLLILVTRVQAQESPEEIAQKYGVTFPVAELGNCGSIAECRTYCEDPVNATTCIDYAKAKGFYQEDPTVTDKDRILQQAKSILGCDSYDACQNYCEVPANYDRCDSFAKSQGIAGGVVNDPSQSGILDQARSVLGCTSADLCKSFCEQEANRTRCAEFANTVGLHGGEQRVGPGGCNSEATCRTFCSDPANYQICSGFATSSGGTFSGPGGCNSEASCRAYCSEHEDECRSLGGAGGSPPPGYDPQQMCNRTPNCAWQGNTCQCGFYGETEESRQKAGEYATYCQANPDKCQSGQAGGFGSPVQRQEFESFCRQNPERCQPPTGGYQGGYQGDPATECAKQSGCSWTGTTCQCSGSGTQPNYSPYPQPTSGSSYDPATECAKTSGCSWTGSSCQCSTSTQTTTTESNPTSAPTQESQPTSESTSTDPATACNQTSGCSWIGSTCQCGSTQGISTNRDFLQIILEWLGF
ncbi:hypothetical protein HYT18_04805 [Candidatus Microgenomates bacterium]|nr:hypothetical protein [Candidatus Microgenomates bacterium]